MKAIHSIFLAALIITAAQFGASGQPAATNINPALLYYQAFLVAPEVSETDHDFIWTHEWQGVGTVKSRLFHARDKPLRWKLSSPPACVGGYNDWTFRLACS